MAAEEEDEDEDGGGVDWWGPQYCEAVTTNN